MAGTRPFWVLSYLGAFVAGVGQAHAAELGLAAGNDIVWIYQTRIDPPDAFKRLYFAFMSLDRKELRFHPLNQADTGGEVFRAAVRGRFLHAFFRDGTHIRWEPEIRRLAGPQTAFWELKLPDAYVPQALAGDASADVLYAVVPGRIAEALDNAAQAEARQDETPRAASQPAAATRPGLQIGPAPDPPPSTSAFPTTRPVLSKYCLVRYERGVWRRDREIAGFFDDQSACLLAVDQATCDLYFARTAPTEGVWHARTERESWSAPEPLPAARWNDLLACARGDDKSFVLTRGDDGALALLSREPDGWRTQRRIELPAEGATAERRNFSAALSAHTISAAWTDPAGRIRAALWDASGEPRAAPHEVIALRPMPVSERLQSLREYAPFVVLGLALIYVFSRRRQSVLYPAALQAGQRLCGHGRRLAAFCLDAVVVAPLALPILYGWTKHFDADRDIVESVQIAMSEHFVELFWRWLAALGGFVLYSSIFEMLRGGTPGKLLLGCRVVSEQGQRCSVRAILLRNVFRVVELFPGLDFAPLLLLVFLTRNRQRLGDLVARSVVVELQPKSDG